MSIAPGPPVMECDPNRHVHLARLRKQSRNGASLLARSPRLAGAPKCRPETAPRAVRNSRKRRRTGVWRAEWQAAGSGAVRIRESRGARRAAPKGSATPTPVAFFGDHSVVSSRGSRPSPDHLCSRACLIPKSTPHTSSIIAVPPRPFLSAFRACHHAAGRRLPRRIPAAQPAVALRGRGRFGSAGVGS